MDIGILEIGSLFDTFAKACAAIKNYATKTNTVLILDTISKNPDEHNYEICLEATKFSTTIRKFDQNDFELIEKLSDDGLQTKDIFLVLNSVSSKYVYKPDIYNAMSCQCQCKLQGLSKIEVLLKTLKNDNNIIGDIAIKPVYNDEHDQNGEFIQAIFWAYHNAIHEVAIAKDVLIIDTTYKTNRFSIPLVVICSIDHFGSLYPLAYAFIYSETRDFYCWIMQQLNKVLTILTSDAHITTIITNRKLVLMATTSLVFPYAKHQLCIWYLFKNIQNKLKKNYAFETFIKPQQDLAMISAYEITYENRIYNVIQIDSPKNLTYIPLYIHVPPNEVHKHWHIQQTLELEYVVDNVLLPVIQIFKQLPQCHYDSFLDIMQCALEHVTKNGKVLELLSNKNIEQKTIYRTINIDNVADYNKIIMPKVKHKRGRSSNNGCIHGAEHIRGAEKKENRVSLKKAKNNKMPHLNNVILDIHIPHEIVLEVYNPISNRNCNFWSLA
ncbi:27679_t:CDS:2, partial [Gigaspora margarita]